MADDFQSFKVDTNEQSSSTKFDNFVQAVEDAVNSIDNANVSAAAGIAVSKLAAGSTNDVLRTTAGVATWAPVPTPSNAIYVAAPTGTAATDTPAIQAAHDALPANGGKVILCPGNYAIDPAAPLNFTKSIHLEGAGKGLTILTFNSQTGTAITTSGFNCTFADFWLKNTFAGTPSAGAGFTVSGGGLAGIANTWRRLAVSHFYRCFNITDGDSWTIDDCHIFDFTFSGVAIQNLVAADAGDMSILNSWITAGPTATANVTGVEWYSGGGLRLLGNKFNSSAVGGGSGSNHLMMQPADGVATGVLIVTGNSFENFAQFGIRIVPQTTSGTFKRIVISANEFFGGGGVGTGVALDPATTSKISEARIGDNTFASLTKGIVLTNVDRVTYGANLYASTVTTPVDTSGGGNTNLLAIGSG